MTRLAAVLLAAGSSARLGQPKQLVRLRGETLVRRAASLLLDLKVEPIVVVTGHRSVEVAAELSGLPLILTDNRDWELGMGSSIACGIHAIPEEVDGVLLMLCDQWRIGLSDLIRLKSAWISDISQIMVAQWKADNSLASGPPIIFPCDVIHELIFIKKDGGARPVIERNREIVRFTEIERAAWDLDNPKDLDLLREF